MKKRLLALVFLALGMSACASPGAATEIAPPTATPAPEPTQTEVPKPPEEVQAELMGEWRPAYDQASVLLPVCHHVWKTNVAYGDGAIDLERARVELAAEAGLLSYAREIPSSAAAPTESVAPFLARSEQLISALIDVAESGDAALGPSVFDTVAPMCNSASSLMDEITATAKAAGLTTFSINQLASDIRPVVGKLYDEEEWVTLIPEPTAPPVGQQVLKDEWRPAYNQGAVLFETCTMTYNTHADFGQGMIGLERARAELEVEAEFVEYVLRGIASVVPQGEAVASHVLRIEAKASALTEWLEPEDDDIGTPEALAAVEAACSSLQGRMDAIVADAKSAGMNTASFGELDSEISPMIEDLYNRTWWGR